MRHPLHSICPYFAMFPESFAERHIAAFTEPGQLVYDPFSGRGTTVFQALLMGRRAAASDINPVAFCISRAKGHPPAISTAQKRVRELRDLWEAADRHQLAETRANLPPFFGRAFYWTTLEQVLFVRRELDWEGRQVDCFLAALCLGALHGDRDKSPYYFSNQMPRTISPKPDYSLRYWRERDLWPHKRDVFDILEQRIKFRLERGQPSVRAIVRQCDVRQASRELAAIKGAVRLICTSPPYFDVTNYEEDQWLRLWFLGGPPHPTYNDVSRDDRHSQKSHYWRFLAEAWQGIRSLLHPDAIIVCRMSGKGMGFEQLRDGLMDSLRPAAPNARLLVDPERSELRGKQTNAFRPGSNGCKYEWDFVVEV